MTLDELKAEAKKQGYHLVKIPEKITMLPCPICGHKRTEQWFGYHGKYRKCYYCGFLGHHAKSDREAKKKWNEAVMNICKGDNKNGCH